MNINELKTLFPKINKKELKLVLDSYIESCKICQELKEVSKKLEIYQGFSQEAVDLENEQYELRQQRKQVYNDVYETNLYKKQSNIYCRILECIN